MRGDVKVGLFLSLVLLMAACTTYRARPLSFRAPSAYPNSVEAAGAVIGAKAYVDGKEAEAAFGFDIRGAGMLPVQVVLDNQGEHDLALGGGQTFLEDQEGNLWPVLEKRIAYERATRYARTKHILKEGGYHGLLGAGAGAIVGAAIGIVAGESVAASTGKGAAVGAAAGGLGGGLGAYGSGDAREEIIRDLRSKSMENRTISPGSLAHGFIFFPGEAESAKALRIQVEETETGRTHGMVLELQAGLPRQQ